ncbi:MAG: helix-turn-helix domain-containing protein [Clostridiales bacterium]|nr:helix-turn-helix domain-containing protein [Clostridiales bacterium]
MTIGERIADLRKKNGFSQEMLGEKLGVSRQAVSKWESDAALPEIDKLVELAKLFDVTVGFLLGVEEGTGMQESIEQQQENGSSLQADADCLQMNSDQPKDADQKGSAEGVLEDYLEKLSKAEQTSQKEAAESRRRSRRRYGVFAAAAGICMVILFICVVNLRREMTDLQNQLYNVQASVDSVSSSISSSIAAQVESILSEQNSILTQSSLELESADYVNKTVIMRLEAMPKETVDSADVILFTAKLSDGETLQAEDVSLDEAGLVTARIELPMENDIDFYLRVGDNTVWLSDEGNYYNDLMESLVPTFVTIFYGTSYGDNSAAFDATMDLYVSDAESEVVKQTDSAPEVSLWLMRGEEKIQELDYEKIDQDDEDILGCWSVTADFELNAEELSPAVEPGEEFRVAYEVDYGNGVVFSGTTDEYLVLTDKGGFDWETDASDVVSSTYYVDNY